jgi:hypothetical protein
MAPYAPGRRPISGSILPRTAQYKHWKLIIDGRVATLSLDVRKTKRCRGMS